MSQTLKLEDNHHNTIGYVIVESNGDKKLEDKHHNTLGYYKKSSDRTEDNHHNTVGHGDILTSLLK